MTKLQIGDRVWATKRDGACATGWWELRRNLFGYWCVQLNGESHRLKYIRMALDEAYKVPEYIHMVEQLICDGSWPE